MLKQENPWGCGLYAVANACNLPDFVTKERLQVSKKYGNTIGQLSKWLKDDGYPYSIDVLYYNHMGKKLPNSALHYKPVGDGIAYLPILMTVRFRDGGKNHMIGGKIDKEGNLFLYDSLQNQEVETTLSKVNRSYPQVFGLYILMDVISGDYVFISQ